MIPPRWQQWIRNLQLVLLQPVQARQLMKHILQAGWAGRVRCSLLLTPACQPTPQLMPCHGHIHHHAWPWDKSKLEMYVLRGLITAQKGVLERGQGSAESAEGSDACSATPGCSKKPGCRAGCSAQPLHPGQWVWGAGTGPPMCPLLLGTPASVAGPCRAAGEEHTRRGCRWRATIAAWHAN